MLQVHAFVLYLFFIYLLLLLLLLMTMLLLLFSELSNSWLRYKLAEESIFFSDWHKELP